MLRAILFVGAGSCIGGISRYLLMRSLQTTFFTNFPFGTAVVNISGCLLIGLFYGLFERGGLMNADLRLFLTVGFCGGFTTFSTFIHEDYAFLQNGSFFYATLYAAVSLVLGMGAAYFGHFLIKII
jgi:fluoride exporter